MAANEPDLDPAGVLHRRAANIYADTVMLVEKVEDVGELRRMEEKVRQLRNAWIDGCRCRWHQRRAAAPGWEIRCSSLREVASG